MKTMTKTLMTCLRASRAALRKQVAIRTVNDPSKPGGVIKQVIRDPNKVFELSQMEELREAMNDHRPKGEGRSRSRDEDVFGVGNRKSERKSADAWLRFKKSRDKSRNKRCQNCGGIGHLHTSQMCPYYGQGKGRSYRDQQFSDSSASSEESGNENEPSGDAAAVADGSSNKLSFKLDNFDQEKLGLTKNPKISHQKLQEAYKAKDLRKKESEEYLTKHPNKNQRRRDTPASKMRDVFLEILKKYTEDPTWKNFKTPVRDLLDSERFREYRKKVQEPMDLETIQKKVNDLEVLDPRMFLDLVNMIYKNCRLFWGDLNLELVKNSLELYERIKSDVEARREELETFQKKSYVDQSDRRPVVHNAQSQRKRQKKSDSRPGPSPGSARGSSASPQGPQSWVPEEDRKVRVSVANNPALLAALQEDNIGSDEDDHFAQGPDHNAPFSLP
jgi:hypothetical protein